MNECYGDIDTYPYMLWMILQAVSFLCDAASSSSPLSVICDSISICSHLARCSSHYTSFVMEVFRGGNGNERLLLLCIHDMCGMEVFRGGNGKRSLLLCIHVICVMEVRDRYVILMCGHGIFM